MTPIAESQLELKTFLQKKHNRNNFNTNNTLFGITCFSNINTFKNMISLIIQNFVYDLYKHFSRNIL